MVLAETLAELRPAAPVAALFCVLADKDWRRMMRLLAPVVDRFVLTTAPSVPPERAWAVNEAGQFATEAGLSAEIVRDFDDALARVAALGQTVLVTGSFHTVGDAMARLQLSPLCG
jgi:dihydrofolate synthase/folylpolyglutamate synthase